MKKSLAILAAASTVCMLAATAPVFADNESDVQADIDAIHKDNEALRKDMDKLDSDRSAKATAKSDKNYGREASKSVAIGADKTEITEKKAEKKVDQKILAHHQNEASEDNNSTDSQ